MTGDKWLDSLLMVTYFRFRHESHDKMPWGRGVAALGGGGC